MKTVLVSGVGQVIGYGIVRCLRRGAEPVRIVGTDIHAHAVGQAWCDEFVICPPAASKEFEPFLLSLVRAFDIRCLFSGFPQELPVLEGLRSELQNAGVSVVLNSGMALAFGADKWLLAQALSGSEVGILTRLVGGEASYYRLVEELGSPFIVKPRNGASSKGLAVVSSSSQWHLVPRDETYIAQSLVGNDEQEYTAAVYADGLGSYAASVTMHRWLGREGNTTRAEIASTDPFQSTLDMLCGIMKPLGPTNFQFRLSHGIPFVLEVNPRISSSTYMRAMCGYNEASMAFCHYVYERLPEQPEILSRRLIRYAEDRLY